MVRNKEIKEKGLSEFGKFAARKSLDEYTQVIELLRMIGSKGSSTGFVEALKEDAKYELCEILGINEKTK